eukprot:GHVS01056769.1.p1 GENE.GHVS01056769.1~~GHVS01056769.1.p1  ORF type:complete len:488 (+),score=89.97 GHVS01056769.1:243-1706(+)
MPTQSSVAQSSPSMYKMHHLLVNQPRPNQATNLAFSPHNVDTALTMLYYGTGGDTHKQMKELYFNNHTPEEAANNLRLPQPSKTNTACSDNINKQLETAGGRTDVCVQDPYTIDSANRVYLDTTTATATSPPPYSAYQAILAETFDADAQLADFQYQPEVESKKINAWVAERTQQKIRSLLPAGAVTSMARLVLVAALYFKGKWMKPFTPLQKPGSFLSLTGVSSATGEQQGEGGRVVEQEGVRYMAVSAVGSPQSFRPGYYNFDPTKEEGDDGVQSFEWGMEEEVRKTTGLGCQLVEIPYVGENIRMVIIMPDNPLQLSKYENIWAENPEQIEKWMIRLEKSKQQPFIRESTFTLPYFKITEDTLSSSTKMDIPNALKSLGVSDLFDSNCNLSKIDPTADLVVSDIVHKCTVEVDEKGTVATAATAAVISLRALPVAGVNVKVDRPFIFQIRLRTKQSSSPADDVVLFMGRVADVKQLQPPQTVTE